MSGIDLREVGAVLVVATAWQGGRLLVRPLVVRPRELGRWQTFLRRLESEVAWEGRELGDALERAARGLEGSVERAVAVMRREARTSGRPTAEIWAEAVRGVPWLLATDRMTLMDLGPVLGRYSRAEQAEQLRAVRGALGVAEQEAADAAKRQARALATLVTLAGVALAVLLV
jgi:stage III sporulation protein AB